MIISGATFFLFLKLLSLPQFFVEHPKKNIFSDFLYDSLPFKKSPNSLNSELNALCNKLRGSWGSCLILPELLGWVMGDGLPK